MLSHDPARHSPVRSIERMPRGPDVQFLTFDGDPLAPPEEAELLARALGRPADVRVRSGSGHAPFSHRDPGAYFEHPARAGRALAPGAMP